MKPWVTLASKQIAMKAFENAKKFFEACQGAKGWEGCRPYVEPGAVFFAQCEPCVDIHTVKVFCECMAEFGTVTSPEGYYDLNCAAFDQANRMAMFFCTYHARHTGEGGPVSPTNKKTSSHCAYILTMSENDKVERMIKVWNSNWAMRELGWL